MPSKALRDAVRLAIDIAGMRGPFSRQDIADTVYGQHGTRLLSVQDEREAFRMLILSYVREVQNEPLSSEEIAQLNVPRKHMHLLDKLPKTICICPSGKHVLSIIAAPSDWAAHAGLLGQLKDRVAAKANKAADIQRMLASESAGSLLDLGQRIAA